MAKTKSKSATYNPKNTWKYDLKKNGVLYLIFLIPFTFLLIFKYIPNRFHFSLCMKHYCKCVVF